MPLCVWMGGLSPLCGPSPPSSLHCEEAPAHQWGSRRGPSSQCPGAPVVQSPLCAIGWGGGSSEPQAPKSSSLHPASSPLTSCRFSVSLWFSKGSRLCPEAEHEKVGNRYSESNVGSEGPKTREATARGMCTPGRTRAKVEHKKLSGVTGQTCGAGSGLGGPTGCLRSLVMVTQTLGHPHEGQRGWMSMASSSECPS